MSEDYVLVPPPPHLSHFSEHDSSPGGDEVGLLWHISLQYLVISSQVHTIHTPASQGYPPLTGDSPV